jgi:hypothetical protein
MQLKAADPDLETLVGRIRSGDLDLQPEFQRGEVWSEAKRQRLIDSIIREWQVPPVHIIIDDESNRQSVLDGQQRLAAIRDFFDGKVAIDGSIEPFDQRVASLSGRYFQTLPPEVRRKVERYSVRVFYITDYSPEEPGELFYRLNQNSALSPAEQRNAFFGRARRQVKELVADIEKSELNQTYFAFSNARMAYDDTIARALLLLEAGSLRRRISSSLLVEKYRSRDGFADAAVSQFREGLALFAAARPFVYVTVKFNKATALSWFVFASRVARLVSSPRSFAEFVSHFEIRRSRRTSNQDSLNELPSWSRDALAIYDDRASARVGDVASVVLRDFVIWIHFIDFVETAGDAVHTSFEVRDNRRKLLSIVAAGIRVERLVERISWGEAL